MDFPADELDVLTTWMDDQGLERGPIESATTIGGGTQNVLVRIERNGRDFVFRRGPRHLRATSNDAIRKEMHVLEALSTTDVPHPRFIAGCPDETLLGAAFYLTELVDGFNPAVELPALYQQSSAVRREAGFAVVDAIAALGRVDAGSIGLGDLGHPDGFLERQVPRWLRELDSYRSLDGYPGSNLPGLDGVARWLSAHRPPTFTAGLSHGDYHLANILLRVDAPVVAAIVDWEMCTVGDPLLDVGWLLATWPDHDDAVGGPLAAAGDLPTREEIVARYRTGSPRDLSHIRWYEVLACLKLGIILEGTHARACAGLAPVPVGDRLHNTAVQLFQHAQRRIQGG